MVTHSGRGRLEQNITAFYYQQSSLSFKLSAIKLYILDVIKNWCSSGIQKIIRKTHTQKNTMPLKAFPMPVSTCRNRNLSNIPKTTAYKQIKHSQIQFYWMYKVCFWAAASLSEKEQQVLIWLSVISLSSYCGVTSGPQQSSEL